ncbi:zinc finger and BTB domain-containing protein 44 [Papilio machaon]|uniref:zinc finger and BTB domain-containing protein 44 n=1 Tax=Papilio machaon TaxID=76193 RepID=UPI001E66557C|nr:zinc finger and BTB domain-containing protein 44 [Papilio machaon]
MVPQQYCLRWKHHHTNVQNMFAQLLEKERFCDVTLYCSPSFATQVPNKDTVEPEKIRGVSLRAHRVVLAACSELLAALLGAHEAHGEPVLVIDGAEPRHLRALLDYMYTGEMSVHHSQLASLLKTAEELRIKGLTDIRWSNKDEPPDCESGVVTTTTMNKSPIAEKQQEKTSVERRTPEFRHERPVETRPERPIESRPETTETRFGTKQDSETSVTETSNKETKSTEKFNVNGGPPPLIKLPLIEKTSPVKRETDTKSPSPKRKRLTSGTEHTDEGSLTPKTEGEWQHGNLDISAERVVSWGAGDSGEWSRDASDDEWADAPADIGSFLSTSLRVDGDNSAEDSEDSTAHTGSSSTVTTACPAGPAGEPFTLIPNPNPTGKSKQIDPRFTDVVKLNDYLQHGRRPQFWEESYVKKVMEAVRLKELEMKHAAELLGVSYGTLYGRYRDVYGCINRPYRVCSTRELWHAGPADVLERLQRGEVTREAAALALGVSPANLAAYVLDLAADKEFEPIPIEMDSSVKMRTRTVSGATAPKPRKSPHNDRQSKKSLGNVTDEESGAASAHDKCQYTQAASSGKWPSIRVASIESLREASASGASPSPSPSALMRTRPDLTIVAARRRDEDN